MDNDMMADNMILSIDELIVYRQLKDDELLRNICTIFETKEDVSSFKGLMIDTVSKLTAYCENSGFHGNLWSVYITNLLVNDENSYSRASEINGSADGSISTMVLRDMSIFHKVLHYDIKEMLEKMNLGDLSGVCNYNVIGTSHVYNSRISEKICSLAVEIEKQTTAEALMKMLTEFYNQYGVGRLGLHKAFRIVAKDDNEVDIIPILKIAHVSLDDLVGYEIPKKKLIDNTEAFIKKLPSNNCLLYGDAGTGKSSSIKAIANEYYDSGLRIIEVYRNQFKYLNSLIAQIKDRNYRFIIYMDDLSFEDFETEYKYLKAVIEGGLERKPENVLIYATSNRRHLIRETVSDRDDRDPDMHRSDTMAEKLSLSARFGVSIYFGSPDKKEFNNIVTTLAERHNIEMSADELILEANKWELSHGGLSGRTAQQFIDHILGQGGKV